MMESAFIDKKELSAILHVGAKYARQLCAAHGVLPVKMAGRGKTAPLLWAREDVMRVVDILRTQARAAPHEYVKPRKGDLRIAGKTAAQIYAMVTQ